ncbi:ATP-binding protein [Sneathiella marina]|uniref:histidine kinase n=1 Tax=Sneathiella marina TaxID=2950108 RepID=A0ABY4W6R0_9PROT|nr:ATP-binding protein [Sneathiella marina]USG62871.1 ATP-binding protein [Sneathiella marina]
MSKSGWLDKIFRSLSQNAKIVPAILTLSMILAVIIAWQNMRTDQEIRLNSDTRNNLDHFTARLQSHITSRLAVGQHLRREWENGYINDTAGFIAEATSAHLLFTDFQAINWINSDGVIETVTPFVGNEAVVGVSVKNLATARKYFLAAEQTGQPQTTPPITLKQLGKGFVCYVPVIKNGKTKGYINLVFRTVPLVTAALGDGLFDNYHLIIKDAGIDMYNSANVVADARYALSRSISVGNRQWDVTIEPTSSLLASEESASDDFVLVGGILFSLAVGYFLFLALAHQQKRRASETIFRTFIELSPSAILIKDATGHYLHANEVWHKWFNPERENIVGKHVNQLFPPDHANLVNMEEHAVLTTGQPIEKEIISPFKDGSRVPTLLQKFPILDDDGSIIAIGGINTDMRAAKKTEKNLRQALIKSEEANHSKSKFLATMSHELRTPLNAIIGFSDIMIGEYFGKIGNQKYVEYSKDIHSSGQHLLALIDEVLDISAIELGKRDLVLEPLDLSGILSECVKSVKARAISGHVYLELEANSPLPPVFVDETAIKQIFLNLLTNAIKFTRPGDRITLSATTTKDTVVVTVSDTGQGIAPEHLTTITEPFVKGQHTPLIADEGVGLGLSIVKSLLDAQQGRLSIESELNQGTTVTVALPKLDREKAA